MFTQIFSTDELKQLMLMYIYLHETKDVHFGHGMDISLTVTNLAENQVRPPWIHCCNADFSSGLPSSFCHGYEDLYKSRINRLRMKYIFQNHYLKYKLRCCYRRWLSSRFQESLGIWIILTSMTSFDILMKILNRMSFWYETVWSVA